MVGRKRVKAPGNGSQRYSKKIKTSVIPIGKIPKQLSLLGSKVKTKLRYVEYFTLNPAAAGLPATHVFSANGLYDPNITGVGHQPRGFDQLMALYDHYYVSRSKIIADFASISNNSVAPWVCGIVLDDDATPRDRDWET